MQRQLLKYLQQTAIARGLIIAGIVTFALIAISGTRYSTTKLSDFAGYYGAAHVVLEGHGPALYDDHSFSMELANMGINEPTMIWYVNPPPATIFMLPVAWLPPFTAKIVWDVLLVLIVFGTWRIGVAVFDLRELWKQGIFFIVLSVGIPSLRNFQRGQIYFLLLLLVLLLWQGYREDLPWLSGLGLGGLLLLKYFGWMFLVLFIARKQWRHLGATAAVVVMVSIIGVTVFGLETYQAHLGRLMLSFRDNDQFFTGLPSAQAWFGAMFVQHNQYNPVPLLSFSGLAVSGIFLSAGILIWLALRDTRLGIPRTFLGILVLSVIFTPLAAEHHYVLLSLPLAVMLIEQIESGTTLTLSLGLVAAVLILGWLPAMPIATHSGITKLFCFGRLYGAIGLFALMLIAPKPGRAKVTVLER